MKRLPSHAKAFARIQIEQIMYQAEFNTQPVVGEYMYGRRQQDVFSQYKQNQPSYPGFGEQILRSSTPSSASSPRGSEYSLTSL